MRPLLWAVLGGAAMQVSVDPHRWWLAIVGWALVSAALDVRDTRHRMWHALVFAVVWFAPTVSWIGVLGRDAHVLLTVLCVVPWVALAAVDVRTARGGWTLAAVAVVVEWARSSIPWGGFPWGLVAYTQLDGPLVEWARVGGDALVTAWVVLLGNALWRMVTGRGHLLRYVVAAATVLLLHDAPVTGTLTVAAIQGNVPRIGLDDVTQAQGVFDNHVAETGRLIASDWRPDLVVWPENAADSDPTVTPANGAQITRLASALDRPILVGALLETDQGGPTNSGILWQPDGTITGRYDKHHLVPFGEYLPLRDVLAPRIGRFDQVPRDLVPGTGSAVIPLERPGAATVQLGTVICFEVAYDEHMTAAVRQGAQVFVVQSNNATYAYTDQPSQQLAITRFRAIEHQRAAVVATTTGDSALVAPDGTVLVAGERMVAQTVRGTVPLVDQRALVDRTWPWVRWGSLVVCLGAGRRSWRSRKVGT